MQPCEEGSGTNHVGEQLEAICQYSPQLAHHLSSRGGHSLGEDTIVEFDDIANLLQEATMTNSHPREPEHPHRLAHLSPLQL